MPSYDWEENQNPKTCSSKSERDNEGTRTIIGGHVPLWFPLGALLAIGEAFKSLLTVYIAIDLRWLPYANW